MTYTERHARLTALVTKALAQKESPAYLIKLYQELAATSLGAVLQDEPTPDRLLGSWHDEATTWVNRVKAIAKYESVRGLEAWTYARQMMPWRKRIFIRRRPTRDWLDNHVQFDRYRAVLDIDDATEGIE